MNLKAADLHGPRRHEAEASSIGCQACEHASGGGTLQRQQRSIAPHGKPDPLRQPIGDVLVIGVLAAGIHDEEQASLFTGIERARHHQVVENAAVVRQQLRVALLAGLEIENIGGNQRFHGAGYCLELSVLGDEKRLPHVAHIKKTRLFAGPKMLLQHA